MNKEQVIARLCSLVSEVGRVVYRDQEAHDCFCRRMTYLDFSLPDAQVSEKIIGWIENVVENAVRENIESKKTRDVMPTMKVFDRDGKINFVDKNNVVLGYDMNQDCCENANWFKNKRKGSKLYCCPECYGKHTRMMKER